jgi:hypothetical protein
MAWSRDTSTEKGTLETNSEFEFFFGHGHAMQHQMHILVVSLVRKYLVRHRHILTK